MNRNECRRLRAERDQLQRERDALVATLLDVARKADKPRKWFGARWANAWLDGLVPDISGVEED